MPPRAARQSVRPDLMSETRSSMLGLPSRKGRIRSAERVEAHLSASSLRNLLSARCADNGRFDERRSPCRPIHRGATPASRPSQSPPSEGPGQGPAQDRRGGIDHRCAVQDRASLRVCELAEAQGSRRLLRGDRATQAGHRHQRHRSRQDHDDAQPGAAQRSTWLRQRWAAHVGCRMPRAHGNRRVRRDWPWRNG